MTEPKIRNIKINKKNPLLQALDKVSYKIYFDNESDYKKFIKELFGENPKSNARYSWKGNIIIFYNKHLLDLIKNDLTLKEII